MSTVDAPVEWGRFASLGFGADGRAVVSHGSKTAWDTYDLALTQCTDQTCKDSTTRIEPWRVSDHTSMATGADWLPVWSFHDENGGRLVVGQCDDARCSSMSYSVVDPLEPVPPGTPTNSGVLGSTAIGANGNPIIVYRTGQTASRVTGLRHVPRRCLRIGRSSHIAAFPTAQTSIGSTSKSASTDCPISADLQLHRHGTVRPLCGDSLRRSACSTGIEPTMPSPGSGRFADGASHRWQSGPTDCRSSPTTTCVTTWDTSEPDPTMRR